MKILFIASENSPYAQVGGLSQVISFLSRSLRYQKIDARIFMPRYGTLKKQKYKLDTVVEGLKVPTGHTTGQQPRELICNVKKIINPGIYSPTYLLENKEYFELRANAYGYSDDHVRFYLLSIGCLEWLLENQLHKRWIPDIIHAHDWHTGYLVENIKKNPRYKSLRNIKVLFTVHNFLHQGNYDFRYATKPDNGHTPLLPCFDSHMRQQNPLLRGIIYADHVNTVSKKHASEVQTKEFGEGLQKYLKKYSSKLSGIANGIDTTEMDPHKDKNIKFHYSIQNLKARAKNKPVLQKAFGLPQNPDTPLVAYIGRYSAQKGIELILRALEHLDVLPEAQYIFLGGGDASYCTELSNLASEYPKKVGVKLQLDFKLSRKLFAGSDIVLTPSRFEPGGIVAMEALRYGAVPIASNTGGLTESVIPYSPEDKTGNGFLHKRKDLWSFYTQLVSALQLYHVKTEWKRLVQNGMRADHSWDNTAKKYIKLYKELLA